MPSPGGSTIDRAYYVMK